MFPNPTAEPATAITYPNRPEKLDFLFVSIEFPLFNMQKELYKNHSKSQL